MKLDFDYGINTSKDENITITLRDKWDKPPLGYMSVKHGLPETVEHICLQEQLSTAKVRVLYYDFTDKLWKGYDPVQRKDFNFGATSMIEGIKHLDTLYKARIENAGRQN